MHRARIAIRRWSPAIPVMGMIGLSSCAQTLVEQMDQRVYRTIEATQQASLGETHDVYVGEATVPRVRSGDPYDFNPHPLTPHVPELAELAAREDGANQAEPVRPDTPVQEPDSSAAIIPSRPDAEDESVEAAVEEVDDAAQSDSFELDTSVIPGAPADMTRFSLSEALAYAQRNARELQNAKEDLYLAALDLTLERHLWTPQFAAAIRGEFADFGQVRDFDRAMTAVSEVSVAQRLPLGGEVSARLINTLMRDLGEHITSGESGDLILAANIPLFRGAGRVAYESRYQAEREIVYAARAYEDFRRAFAVSIAADFFNLQQLRAAIENAEQNYINLRADWLRAEFIQQVGQSRNVFDAARALASFRDASARLVDAQEAYASALDRFKIRFGMPVEQYLDVLSIAEDVESAAVEEMIPAIDEDEAILLALKYRLDLITELDRVDDQKRGVAVAENQILPDLDFTGSAAVATDPAQKNSMSFNTERTTWRAQMELRMDDRMTERRNLRSSLIDLRRAGRDLEIAEDQVIADVRRAVRRIDQQARILEIQQLNVAENEFRVEASRAQFELQRATNQDVVDAQADLLNAKNRRDAAILGYRLAVLEFLRDTALLRVDDNGQWRDPRELAGPPQGAGGT